jgi:penicillin amidase
MNKALVLLALFAVLLIIKLNFDEENIPQGIPHKVQIYRDEYGIPHVIGKSKNDISFGVGYAQAQDRAWTLFFKKKLIKG